MALTRGRFYLNEIESSTDFENAMSYIFSDFADIFNSFVYNGNTVVLTGLTPSAQSPASGQVNIATGIASQAGYPIEVTVQQVANILSGSPGSNTWGTGQAATSQPRIDIVVCQYATLDGNPQTRNVNDGGTITPTTLNVSQTTYYAFNVVHGTPASSPVAPSVPSGWFLVATVAVPASASTITSGDVTDNTLTLRTSGGWLSNVSGGILWRNDSAAQDAPELDTASGILLKFGTSGAQAFDNTGAGYLDITGGTNGVRFPGAVVFAALATFNGGLGGSGSLGSLTAGAGILNTAQAWGAVQNFGNGNLKFGGAATAISSPASGQALTYNGTNWVNAAIAASSLSGTVANTQLAGPLLTKVIAGTNVTVSTAPASGTGSQTVSVTAFPYSSLTGVPSSFTPSAHESTHLQGGSDALSGTLAVSVTGNAGTATYATSAGSASTATSAGSATTATTAGSLGDTMEYEVCTPLFPTTNAVSIQTTTPTPITSYAQFTPEIGAVNSAAKYYMEAWGEATGGSYTNYIAVWDVTAGAIVSGSTVSTTSSSQVLLRSGAFTPVAGHKYTACIWASEDVDALVYGMRIVAVI